MTSFSVIKITKVSFRSSYWSPGSVTFASISALLYRALLAPAPLSLRWTSTLNTRLWLSTARMSSFTDRPCKFLIPRWLCASRTRIPSSFRIIRSNSSAHEISSNTLVMKSSSNKRKPLSLCRSSWCFFSKSIHLPHFLCNVLYKQGKSLHRQCPDHIDLRAMPTHFKVFYSCH